MALLAGKRILVVEGNFLIGAMVSEMLAGAQIDIVGPARTRERRFKLARTEHLNGAVLDIICAVKSAM